MGYRFGIGFGDLGFLGLGSWDIGFGFGSCMDFLPEIHGLYNPYMAFLSEVYGPYV